MKAVVFAHISCFFFALLASLNADDDFICELPAETSNCKLQAVRWFHDVKDGECKQFVYGGCGGNSNNFASKSACESRCVPGHQAVIIVDDVCQRGNPCGLFQRCVPLPVECTQDAPCVMPFKTFSCEPFPEANAAPK